MSSRFLHALVIAIFVMAWPVMIAHAADSYQVASGSTATITEHTVCKVVKNNHSSGLALFVPTKTPAEWQSFYDHTPPGVTATSCLALEYLGTKTSNANTTGYTFSNVNFGAEDPTRRIVIVVANGGDSFVRTLSATVAGVSATQMVHGGADYAFVTIFIAAVPTGTTGTISLSYSSPTVNHVVVGVYKLVGLSANTPFATSTYATSPPANLGLAVPAGGCVIAGIRRSASSTFTWSGLDENYDLTISGGGGAIAQGYSGASKCFANASPSQSITVTPTATGNPSAAAVAWGQ